MNRALTLSGIVAVHAALLVAMLHSSLLVSRAADANSVQVSFVAPPEPQRVQVGRLKPQSLSANLLASVSAPSVAAIGEGTNGSGARAGNDGLNADWVAEAHRAVRAYEIRRDQAPLNPIAGASRDYLELQREHVHRAGDRYKTENGDWIVWIDDHCYKIAEWHRGEPNDGTPPKVVCPGQAADAGKP
jgi:hypothetical protein